LTIKNNLSLCSCQRAKFTFILSFLIV